MPPAPQFWDATKSFQINSNFLTSILAGNVSPAVEFWIFNDKGGALNATTMTGYRLMAEAWDGASNVKSGPVILNEAWIEVAIIGVDKTGDPAMVDQITGYTPIGAGRPLALSPIPKNCGRKISARVVVPLGASRATPNLELVVDTATATLSGTDIVAPHTNVPYAAGNFTSSSGTWGVDAADQVTLHYLRIGSLVMFAFDIKDTNVTGPPFGLRIALPSGMVAAATTHGGIFYQDAGGTWTNGHWEVVAGNAFLSLYKTGYSSNWTVTAANNTRVRGTALLVVVP